MNILEPEGLESLLVPHPLPRLQASLAKEGHRRGDVQFERLAADVVARFRNLICRQSLACREATREQNFPIWVDLAGRSQCMSSNSMSPLADASVDFSDDLANVARVVRLDPEGRH